MQQTEDKVASEAQDNKCDTCFYTRWIISENGRHSICILSDAKAIRCSLNKYNQYQKHPMLKGD